MKHYACPMCKKEPIHARAVNWPIVDTEDPYGYSLKIECSEHGWKDSGDGWTYKELTELGLTREEYYD